MCPAALPITLTNPIPNSPESASTSPVLIALIASSTDV